MAVVVDSFSPSALKPAEVINHWQSSGLPLCLHPVEPVQVADFHRVHDPRYVDGVLEGRIPNGFGLVSPAVTNSLFYTSGSVLSAARWALTHQAPACSPTSGFHHAGYYRGGAYCTFNGLMVAAAALKAAGQVNRVGILDLDCHYGNGTDSILEETGAGAWVLHFSAGREYFELDQVAPFFRRLATELHLMRDCDLVLYQAGADPHIADPLGGWMTCEELEQRDRLVFDWVVRHRKPLVWNLAGGYQKDDSGGIRPVLDIHTRTARAHLQSLSTPLNENTELETRGRWDSTGT